MASRVFAASLTIAAVLWVVVLVAAPLLAHPGGASSAIAALYAACGFICHQRPERSFAIQGVQLPVCARCFGLYAAAAAGAIAAWVPAGRRVKAGSRDLRLALALAALPTLLTVAVERLGISFPSNSVRAAAAVPFGIALGWICVQLLLDEGRDRMQPGRTSDAPRAGAGGV